MSKVVFPNKKYQIIYADPPWSYKDTQKSGGTSYFGACVRYDLMDNESIMSLPVREISDSDSVLFLWAVSPLLPEAIKTISAWGFQYKTVAFCWSKITSLHHRVSNMGRWTMGNVELCLLGVKGKPRRVLDNIKQYVEAIRYEHSRKPDEVRNRIVELMGDLPRIELFARKPQYLLEDPTWNGWDVWGNENE